MDRETTNRPVSQDLLLGIAVAAIGMGAIVVSRGLAFGTPTRIGPGYFPTVVSWLLVATGAVLALRGLRRTADRIGPVHWRAPVLVTLAVVFFALAIERYGLLVAVLGQMAIAILAGRERRWREAIVLALGATLAAYLLFAVGLRLPMKVLP